jgi:serine/threonine-protein kinase
VDVLDSGGVGTVWRVWDHREREYRAAKVLRQSDSDSLLRFVRETSRRITHPHVVAPHGWSGEDDRVLFTMPLVRGGSLAMLLADFGALPPRWVAELLRQALDALGAVHGAGLVHRDVKPANLLLDATGVGRPHLRLSDFGAAARVDAPRLTRADSVIGTPGYLAPEQLRGADPDPRQDVYALGVVGLQMLTGEPPARDGTLPQLLPAPPEDSPRARLAGVLAGMTLPDPRRRPGSAAAALEQLASLSGADDLAWRADGAETVEVFDHVPELPSGWTAEGPERPLQQSADALMAEPAPKGKAAGERVAPDSEPGSRGRPTEVMSRQTGEPGRPGVPLLAWALMALGLVLVTASLLWL